MIALQPIDYRHGEVALQGQLALPAGEGPHPGVLVMYDARGLGEGVKSRARRLAELGYVAFCTDMYGDGIFFEHALDCGPVMFALHEAPELMRERVLLGFEVLKARPEVNTARIGAFGYCFGGQCVLELARSGADVKSVVSFHGSLLTTKIPARLGEVKAKILTITGALDPYAPEADVEALRQEMTAAGAAWQITVYGEGYHAFTNAEAEAEMSVVPGVRYDPLLDKLSWAQGVEMLEATLA
jgi:dienelactone hydrolase